MVEGKRLVARVSDSLYDDFTIALSLRRENMADVIRKFAASYVVETQELKDKGIIKIFGRS